MKRIVEICEDALEHLDPYAPLVEKEDYHALYIPPPQDVLKRLLIRLDRGRGIENQTKILLIGHQGTGKSTTLFHLKRALEQGQRRVTVVYFSVRTHTNLVGLDIIGLIEAMTRAVYSRYKELSGGVVPPLEEKIKLARSLTREERSYVMGRRSNLSLKAETGVVESGLGVETDRRYQQSLVYEQPPLPTAMLELLNEQLAALVDIRKGAPILLMVDDLEKLDVATAERIFAESQALVSVNAAVIYTLPVSLAHMSSIFPSIQQIDTYPTRLPIAKLQDKEGKEIRGSLQWLHQVALQRIPELQRLLPWDENDTMARPSPFGRIARASGGVVRDLIRMLQVICTEVIVKEDDLPPDEAILAYAEAEIRNQIKNRLTITMLERMKVVEESPKDRPQAMDTELPQLLNMTAVLEHYNGDAWYRVHPLALRLLDALRT